jgi:hypothetical protein
LKYRHADQSGAGERQQCGHATSTDHVDGVASTVPVTDGRGVMTSPLAAPVVGVDAGATS